MSGKYTKDVVMQAIARVAGGVLSFLAVFVLTYLFDEAQIGKYNLILSTINVITSIFTLWLSQGILRYYESEESFGFVLTSMFASTILSLLVFYVVNSFTEQDISIHAYIYILVLVFYNIFDALFRKQRKLFHYVLLELILSISRFFPMIIIAYITRDYNAIFISQYVIMLLFIIFFIFRNNIFRLISFKYDSVLLKKYLHFGVPMVGLAISNWFLTSSDRYIIKYFTDDYSVGIYSTNYSLGNSIYMMFALIIVNAFHPIIVKAWDNNETEGKKIVSKTLDYYLMFVSPFIFYGCLKSSVLLSLFKGNTYSEYNDVFIWTVLGIFIYGISLLYHKYYELIQDTKKILLYNLISAICNIVLNIVLIPRFGFSIAAFTTFISYVVYLTLVRITTYKIFDVRFSIKDALKILLSILAFWCVDYMLHLANNLFVFFTEGIVFVIYICLAYYVLKVINVFNIIMKKRSKK